MDGNDIGRLIYLSILVVMVAGWFFTQNRLSTNKLLQQAAVWGLIFLGTIAAYGLWNDISQTIRPQQAVFADQGKIVVPRSPDGHYYLDAEINGGSVQFVLDTGASMLVLTQKDAQAAGLNPDTLNFIGRATTANGEVRTAPVRLDTLSLGPVTDRDVPAVVNGGEMAQSLMGMTYLQRWGKIEIAGSELTLTR